MAVLVPPVALVIAVLTGYGVGSVAQSGRGIAAVALPAALFPFVMWKRPSIGIFVLLGATVTVEQFQYQIGPMDGAATDSIPFFRAVSAGSGVTPAEVLLVLALFFWVMRSAQTGARLLPRSALALCVMSVMALAAIYLAVGLARDGTLKIALWEVRPFFYVGLTYLITASLLGSARAVRSVMWIIVIGSGVKSLYGIYLWRGARHIHPRPDAILAHEESFFFALFIFLTVGLWLWGVSGRLRTVATALLPIVVWADLANSRRTAWAIVGTGTLVIFIVAYARLPHRRWVLRRLAPPVMVACAAYLPAFWNQPGTIGQPARALQSVVAPASARDESSNDYREIEKQNLALNIARTNHLGAGFGIPIDYEIEIVDISGIDPMIDYVPHDNVLWVWLRMGALGVVAFLMMIGAAFLTAGRLTAMHPLDPESAVFGVLVIGALIGYLVMGAVDLGFNWFRIAFCMGVLLGVLEARTRRLTGLLARGDGTEAR